MAKAGPNHKHRWKMADGNEATTGKCWCGARKAFSGGFSYKNFNYSLVNMTESDKARIIRGL